MQFLRQGRGLRLVGTLHADEGPPALGQPVAGRQRRLGEGFAETVTHPHDFAGGLHLRAEYGIDAGELVEREHRLLDADDLRDQLLGESLLLERLAGHAASTDLGQRGADALGDEGHRARGARVHFQHEQVVALHRELHVHQAHHAKLQGHGPNLLANAPAHGLAKPVGRQGAGGVARMHPGLLDVLHDGADHHVAPVADRVHIHFDGLVEEAVEQHRRVVGDIHRAAEVAGQLLFVVDDLHGPPAEHVGRPHDDGKADLPRPLQAVLNAGGGAVGRLLQAELVEHGLEALPVLGAVDGVRAGADDGHPRPLELLDELQRRLAAELHDHSVRALHIDNGQHVLQGDRLEIEAVGGVVVRGHGFRVAVDHDGLVTVLAHGQGRMDAAVVEFDALAHPVRAAAEHHDLAPLAGVGFAILFVGGVHVSRGGGELRSAGIDTAENRLLAKRQAALPNCLFALAKQSRQACIGKALALEGAPLKGAQFRKAAACQGALLGHEILDFRQEPRIDSGQFVDVLQGPARSKGIGDVPQPFRPGGAQLPSQSSPPLRFRHFAKYRVEA